MGSFEVNHEQEYKGGGKLHIPGQPLCYCCSTQILKYDQKKMSFTNILTSITELGVKEPFWKEHDS